MFTYPQSEAMRLCKPTAILCVFVILHKYSGRHTEFHIEDDLPYYQLADPPVTNYVRVKQPCASRTECHLLGNFRLQGTRSENVCT